MLRLRIFAFSLSLLSVVVALWARGTEPDGGTLIALLAAGACLAIVAPFDAPEPPQRRRVLIACIAYLVAVAVAMALANEASASTSMMLALLFLGLFGVGLTLWAFAIRNRRRVSNYHHYYDN